MKLKFLSVLSLAMFFGQAYTGDASGTDDAANDAAAQGKQEDILNISDSGELVKLSDNSTTKERKTRFDSLKRLLYERKLHRQDMLRNQGMPRPMHIQAMKPENTNLKAHYDSILNDQRNEIILKHSKNAKFQKQAEKILSIGIPLSQRALLQEIIEFEISDFRTLFLLAQKSLGNVKNILVTSSTDSEVNRKNEILKKIIENIEKDISEILQQKDLGLEPMKAKYNEFIEKLEKISKKLDSFNSAHPLNSICKHLKYFLNFSMINIDANEFLKKNEAKIMAFYNGNIEISGGGGAYVPVEATGTVTVGQKVGLSKKTGLANRGVSTSNEAKTETAISAGNKIGSVTTKAGLSVGTGKNAVGYNASELIKDKKLSKALKKSGKDIPAEYLEFSRKREEIMKQAADLNNNLVNFEKFLNRYSGLFSVINNADKNAESTSDDRLKVSYLFIDPKYNLENENSIKLSVGGKLEAAKLASLLNMQIKTSVKNTVCRKNNDIYNYIKGSNFVDYVGDFDSFKKVAILCDKFKHIKSAYTKEGTCNVETLKKSFDKFCKKHGNFTDNRKDFINAVEYYANILQELANQNLPKDSINKIRKVKSKLEKQFGTNGRLETLLTTYFMAIGYIVLDKDVEKSEIDKLKFALENISLLLSESRAKRTKKVKDMVCRFSELSANIKFLGDFINFGIRDVIDSPYIYDNGTNLEIDLDFSKIDLVYGKIAEANKKLHALKGNSKLPTCISTVIDAILGAQDKIASKLETAKGGNKKKTYSIIKGMLSGLELLHEAFTKNQQVIQHTSAFGKAVPVIGKTSKVAKQISSVAGKTAAVSEGISPIAKEISSIVKKVSTEASKLVGRSTNKKIIKFIFRINGTDLEFIGIKTRNVGTKELKVDTDAINKLNNARITVGGKVKRLVDSKFVENNDKSLFLVLKDVSDYCFLKLADTGKQPSTKEINDFLKWNFKQSYIQNLIENFKHGDIYNLKNTFTKIRENIKDKSDRFTVNDLMYWAGMLGTTENTGLKENDLLPNLSLLFFKYIAKPYNEKRYK